MTDPNSLGVFYGDWTHFQFPFHHAVQLGLRISEPEYNWDDAHMDVGAVLENIDRDELHDDNSDEDQGPGF